MQWRQGPDTFVCMEASVRTCLGQVYSFEGLVLLVLLRHEVNLRSNICHRGLCAQCGGLRTLLLLYVPYCSHPLVPLLAVRSTHPHVCCINTSASGEALLGRPRRLSVLPMFLVMLWGGVRHCCMLGSYVQLSLAAGANAASSHASAAEAHQYSHRNSPYMHPHSCCASFLIQNTRCCAQLR